MLHDFGEYSPENWICGRDWEGKRWFSIVLDGKLGKKRKLRCPLKHVEAES
jgi:hypothetical protein